MKVRCEPQEWDLEGKTHCGLVYDDAEKSTICPHYPLGTGPTSFCLKCDLYKPCACKDD